MIGEPPLAGATVGLTARSVAHANARLCHSHVALRAVRFHRTASFAAATSRADAPQPSSRGRYASRPASSPFKNFPRVPQTSHGASALVQNRTSSIANAARPGPPTAPSGIGISLSSATEEWNAPSTYSRTTTSFVLVADADPPLPPPESHADAFAGTATNARCVHARTGAL